MATRMGSVGLSKLLVNTSAGLLILKIERKAVPIERKAVLIERKAVPIERKAVLIERKAVHRAKKTGE